MGVAFLRCHDQTIYAIDSYNINYTLPALANVYREGPVSNLSAVERTVYICQQLSQLLRLYQPIHLGIEGAFMSRRTPQAYKSLVLQRHQLLNAIYGTIHYVGITTHMPTEVKSHLGISGRKAMKDKQALHDKLVESPTVGRFIDPNRIYTSHESDAIAIAITAGHHSGYGLSP